MPPALPFALQSTKGATRALLSSSWGRSQCPTLLAHLVTLTDDTSPRGRVQLKPTLGQSLGAP